VVKTFAHPGGNVTGFSENEGSVGGKWIEVLKDVKPGLTHVGTVFNPATTPYRERFLPFIRAAAATAGAEFVEYPVATEQDVARVIAKLGGLPEAGLIVFPDPFTGVHADFIIRSVLRARLLTIYPFSKFAERGGLISYGVDIADLYQHAADYVDRILKGANPAELPVQAPTKYQLVVNLKTAKALGLSIPPMLLARADEVME
jgi:putative ABC transport system substrate-binding protein